MKYVFKNAPISADYLFETAVDAANALANAIANSQKTDFDHYQIREYKDGWRAYGVDQYRFVFNVGPKD